MFQYVTEKCEGYVNAFVLSLLVLFYVQVSLHLFYLKLTFPCSIMTWDPIVTELTLWNVLLDMQLYRLPEDECLQQKHVAAILAIKRCALLTNIDQIHNCPTNSEW